MSLIDMLTQHTLGSGIVIFVIVLTIIQIAPIKIDPWKAIARAIGNAINHDIKKDIKEVKDEVLSIKTENDERHAIACRIRILIFNDELLRNIDHTKDYFDQILTDIDGYEMYCEDHPEFKNNMTLFAIKNIKDCYANCLSNHKFLAL